MTNPTVLFINHKQKQCGVYQYGYRSANILNKSQEYNFVYAEVESEKEFFNIVDLNNPIGIIYNYHPLTMPWLGNHSFKYPGVVHYGLHHEGSTPDHIRFNHLLIVDSMVEDTDKNFSVGRPLLDVSDVIYSKPEIPTISSFGFGFGNKGFGRIVALVNEQYDEAIIRLHIPRAYYGDRDGESSVNIFPGCFNEVKKDGIKLVITTDFLNDLDMLNFLASNSVNVFLYDEMLGRGLSSVIDYALSVNIPIAINKTYMFRHIYDTKPSICVEDRSLSEIIESGPSALQQYREKWSLNNFNKIYENIITNTREK